MILTESCSFLWAIFQLQLLCQSSSPVHTLGDLPMSLDEMYDRILKGIARERQEFAQCLFQCLAVSVRPLCMKELAAILAIHFGTGAHHPEQTILIILSVCPSLITVINMNGSRVVQFSHSSVKEYLKSERLSNAGEPLSRYHILPHSAHAILAQVSLDVLFAIDDQVGKSMMNFLVATYAAQYWVEHAQFDDVSSRIKYLMERLFDPSKSYFATWVQIYDIDHPFHKGMSTSSPTPPEAVPLYYAVLCGFRGLVEHLIFTYRQDINAKGGYYGTPLHAAIAKENVSITTLLLEHGADVAALNNRQLTPLHEASRHGNLDLMELLLNYHAQINACDGDGKTPLTHTPFKGFLDAALFLLRNGATTDSRDNYGWTPLMSASQGGHLDIVRLLIENGATAEYNDNNGWTPLMLASHGGHLDVVSLLLENGATADTSNNNGWTPLILPSLGGHLDVVQSLLQNGATADTHNVDGWTPLTLASRGGHLDVVLLLLRNGATIDSRDGDGRAALISASQATHLDVVLLSLKNSATLDFRDDRGWTPLMTAS